MTGGTNRGFVWLNWRTPIMQLEANGNLNVTGSGSFRSVIIKGINDTPLIIQASTGVAYSKINFKNLDGGDCSAIHSFDNSWQGGNINLSSGALNLTGFNGVTLGVWDNSVAIADQRDLSFKLRGKGLFGSDLETTAVQFTTGFAGQGWKLDAATNHLTVDKLTVRKEFKVYEMIIDQVRAQRGSVVISPGAAKIESGTVGRAYVDTDNGRLPISVIVGDKLRCQQNNGRNSKYLVVNVTAVGSDYFDYTVIDGTGWLGTGDEVVVFGSNDTNRQGIIYITSSDDGAPYIDVLDGVNSHIHTTPRNIRYIRDWSNGSSINDGNHWVEIKALNRAGVNIASGKTVTGLNGSNPQFPLSRVTDDNIDTAYYGE